MYYDLVIRVTEFVVDYSKVLILVSLLSHLSANVGNPVARFNEETDKHFNNFKLKKFTTMNFKQMFGFWWQSMTKDIFNFSGTMSRKEFWIFILFSWVFTCLTFWLLGIPVLWVAIAAISAQVRRFRDINKPAWYVILNYIFLVQLYGYYLTLFVKGDRE